MYAMRDMSKTIESDAFFKSIPPDEFIEDSGNVESPTNWFGLFQFDRADYPDAPASIEDGLYLVSIDNNGLVWAEQADTDWATRANYAELVEQYVLWLDSDI